MATGICNSGDSSMAGTKSISIFHLIFHLVFHLISPASKAVEKRLGERLGFQVPAKLVSSRGPAGSVAADSNPGRSPCPLTPDP